jgi:LmbE family N-acetylglucosaminyl deacetylase
MPVVDLDRIGRYDCLYLSPHGDDVALSCPGRIRGERVRGQSVLVLGLFESRAAEAAAPGAPRDLPGTLARLGADYAVAGLPPARRRQRGAVAFDSLSFGGFPDHDAWLTRSVKLLADIGPRIRPRHLYAPLGVGGHIDHRLTCEAALRAFADEPGRNLFFYEERPEAFVPGAVRIRLGLLGARLPPGAAEAADRAGLARYLLSFHLAAALRGDPLGWSDRLRSTGPAARQWRMARGWNPQRAFGPRMQPVVHPFDPETLPLSLLQEAASALLPDRRGAERFLRLAAAYDRRLGAPEHAERYWLLLPSREEALETHLPTAVGLE